MSDATQKFTLKELAGKPVAGKVRLLPEIKRVVEAYGVGHVDRFGPARIYLLSDVEEACRKFDSDLEKNPDDTKEMADLRKQKLVQEISILTKDGQKKDLQIEQLRNTLIDSEEVQHFLLVRRSIDMALLRRVLFTNMPVEIPGLTIAKARTKGEHYYNDLAEAFNATVELWAKKYNLTDDTKLRKSIEKLIASVDASFTGGRETEQLQVLQDHCEAKHN
jgi:hypothetical protein